ncbi:MAG: hypothetical protein WA191_02810, partial [Telluria sp.]
GRLYRSLHSVPFVRFVTALCGARMFRVNLEIALVINRLDQFCRAGMALAKCAVHRKCFAERVT